MTITVTHSTPADGSFSASGATAWNASHTISGTIDIANGGTGQTTSTAAINALLPTQATNSGKYLTTDGTNTSWATVSSSPGGSTTQVQYNSSGSFAGSANMTFDGTTLTAAGLAGPLNGTVGATTPAGGTFTSVGYKGSTSGTVTLTAPAVAGSQSYTLPTDLPTVEGQLLSSTTAGVLSWTSSLPALSSVEYLVVGGGGGGGASTGGGGGAGGFRASTLAISVGSTYTVTVGAGGAGSTSASVLGTIGSSSVFSSITSLGGGGGQGNQNQTVVTGGSGGGNSGTGNSNFNVGLGTAGQGNNGGAHALASPAFGSGGGGGAGAVGGTGTGSAGGAGGTGSQSSITGTATYYAGGGGGGTYNSQGTVGAGTPSTGGGGAGSFTTGGSGTASTGGGGGGAGTSDASPGTGGTGGSGVVIIAYPSGYPAITTISGGLTYTVSTVIRPGYRVYTFTAGTGTITI